MDLLKILEKEAQMQPLADLKAGESFHFRVPQEKEKVKISTFVQSGHFHCRRIKVDEPAVLPSRRLASVEILQCFPVHGTVGFIAMLFHDIWLGKFIPDVVVHVFQVPPVPVEIKELVHFKEVVPVAVAKQMDITDVSMSVHHLFSFATFRWLKLNASSLPKLKDSLREKVLANYQGLLQYRGPLLSMKEQLLRLGFRASVVEKKMLVLKLADPSLTRLLPAISYAELAVEDLGLKNPFRGVNSNWLSDAEGQQQFQYRGIGGFDDLPVQARMQARFDKARQVLTDLVANLQDQSVFLHGTVAGWLGYLLPSITAHIRVASGHDLGYVGFYCTPDVGTALDAFAIDRCTMNAGDPTFRNPAVVAFVVQHGPFAALRVGDCDAIDNALAIPANRWPQCTTAWERVMKYCWTQDVDLSTLPFDVLTGELHEPVLTPLTANCTGIPLAAQGLPMQYAFTSPASKAVLQNSEMYVLEVHLEDIPLEEIEDYLENLD